MNRSLVGVVRLQSQAERTVTELQQSGVPSALISVLVPDKHAQASASSVSEVNSATAGPGGSAPESSRPSFNPGGGVGGSLGLLAGIGAVTVAGIGQLLVAGPLLSKLSGSSASAPRGLVRALVQTGVPEFDAKICEGKLRLGSILVVVHSQDADIERRAQRAFEQHGAHEVAVSSDPTPQIAVCAAH